MVCDTCKLKLTCFVPENVRVLKTWCRQYKYSRQFELELEKEEHHGRNKRNTTNN